MWPIISLAGGVLAGLFFWLWRSEAGRGAKYLETIGALGQSNDQLAENAKGYEARVSAVVDRYERALRTKSTESRRLVDDLSRIVLAGEGDPGTMRALADDFERLFEMPPETTSDGD
jgi:hypothetical protein